jgi:hypothetical protein
MPTVTCPACGSADDLRGQRTGESVEVQCGACGHSWQRDLTSTCTRCGSTDLHAIPTATLEEAGRGEQRTPSGIRDVYRCQDCGAQDATSSSPVVDPAWDRRPRAVVRPARAPDDEAPATRGRGATRSVDSAFGRFSPGGTVGDRWRLERLVHWSSTGSLWLAQAVDADRQVLFKLVHPRLTNDPRRTGLHASVAKAAVKLRHPHLLPVVDVKVRDGHVLVVARPIGWSILTPASRPAAEPLLQVGLDVAHALAAMHEERVPHLDIRPDKILLDSTGRARLIDLGSGRARAAQRARETSDHRLAFRAPEQILAHDHGLAADVYSVGLTLWTLAGGDLQQMGPNAAAQASHRLTHHVPPLDPGTSGLPDHVTDAIAAATRRPADQRPTAMEFARRLKGGT